MNLLSELELQYHLTLKNFKYIPDLHNIFGQYIIPIIPCIISLVRAFDIILNIQKMKRKKESI